VIPTFYDIVANGRDRLLGRYRRRHPAVPDRTEPADKRTPAG